MSSLTRLGIAALLVTFTLPAFAQDTSVDASTDATAAAATDNSYASATAAVNAEPADLTTVTDASKVSVVPISTLSGDAVLDGATLDEALAAKVDALKELRANAAANGTISAKLAEQGLAVERVVAIWTDPSGNTWIYYDDRM